MTSYFLPLLALVLLCAFWALFQRWLSQVDRDVKEQSLKCGGCARRGDCDVEEHSH